MDKKSFFGRVLGDQAGAWAKTAWNKIFSSAEKKQAEAQAKAQKMLDAVRSSTKDDEAVRKMAEIDVASQKMGPLTKGAIVLGVAVAGTFPYSRWDGYTEGEGLTPQSTKTNPSWYALAGMGLASVGDFGNDGTFVSEAYVNGALSAYDKKLASLSPKEREKWPSSRDMLAKLALGEPNDTIRLAADTRAKTLGEGASSKERSEGETARLQAESSEQKRVAIAKEEELNVARDKETARQQALLDEYKSTEQQKMADLAIQTQQQQAISAIAEGGLRDKLSLEARKGGYKPETLAARFNQLNLLKDPATAPALTSAFAAIAVAEQKQNLGKSGLQKSVEDPVVLGLVKDPNQLKLQVMSLTADLR